MRTLSGGSGTRAVSIGLMHGGAVLNDTDSTYELNYGYNTVANGSASEICIAPGEAACRVSSGSARDFAQWEIGTPEEHTAKEREIKSLKAILRAYA